MEIRNRLWADAVREIAHTKKKFISLLIMNFLAVGFLAGLRMTAPDMKHSLDVYYDEQNLMDVRIVSTLGLSQEDIDVLKAWKGQGSLPAVTDVEGSKSFDALIEEDTVTVFSIPERINRLRLTRGRLAQTEDEWFSWVIRAYQSIFGYEFQGDNVLIARVNILLSLSEHMQERWGRKPTQKELEKISNIVSWNIWQMDGLTMTIPYSEAEERFIQLDLFGLLQD